MKVMSKEIEEIKLRGAKHALSRDIGRIQHDLSRVWEGTMSGYTYVALGKAIKKAEVLLKKIAERLEALNKLDGESK